LHFLRIAAG
jgi:hypothetical protein